MALKCNSTRTILSLPLIIASISGVMFSSYCMFGFAPYCAKYANTAEFLIKNGADVNAKGYYDLTPLHTVPADVVPVLLKYGADPAAKSNRQHSVHLGFEFYHREPDAFAQFLWSLDQENIRKVDEDRGDYSYSYSGLTPLALAVCEKDFEKIAQLLKLSPRDVNLKQMNMLYIIAQCQYLLYEQENDDKNREKCIKIIKMLYDYENNCE